MADNFENRRTRKAHDPTGGVKMGEPEPAAAPLHDLDGPAAQKLLGKLWTWYEQEREKQSANRLEMAIDEDFYDNLQWREDDAAVLEERGQAPLVYNFAAQKLDWIIGTERRTRIDHKVLPRKGGADAVRDADTKTKLMKYVSDVNNAGFARSYAFDESIKVGIGWLEEGVRGDITDEPLYSGWESWRNMLWDSCGRTLDTSDWRYVIRMKSLDLDVAEAMFPDRKDKLRSSAVGYEALVNDDADEFYYLGQRVGTQEGTLRTAGNRVISPDSFSFFNRRERVKLIEIWYRNPVRRQIMRGEVFNGRTYDAKNQMHLRAVQDQAVSLYDAVVMEVRCAIMVKGALIEDVPSPYNHNRFPFIPIWCYKRGRDGMPYGVMRRLRDAQEDFNKRMSKAQHLLATRRVIMEEGAVEDIEELRDEVARPDGIIVHRKGKALEIHDAPQLAEEQVKLAGLDVQFMESGSGVTDENLGKETNAQSGKAVLARQNQGSVVTAQPFDNLRLAFKQSGKIRLSLIEQYFTEPKIVRIEGPRGKQGKPDFIEINQPVMGPDGEVRFLNDITAFEADFEVSEQDFRESMRLAMFEQMLDMMGKLPPEVAIQLLDLVMEFFDVPGKEELVRRIRKLNGQTDPDHEPTPEELAAKKAQDDAAQEQQAMARQAMIAAVQEAQAKVAKLQAEAGKIEADSMAKTIEAIVKAMEGAGMVLAAPAASAAADQILQGAGFKDKGGEGLDRTDMPAAPAQPLPAVVPA